VKLRGTRESRPPTPQDELRERRLARARACRAWTELDRSELIERERGYLVRAETDEAFLLYRGDAFSGSGVVVASMTPLYFTVDDDGVHVLEKQLGTWSEHVHARARAGAR
jgi:hypothetical protein